MFEPQLIKQEPRSPLQNSHNDGTYQTPTHRYTPSPNQQFNIPLLPMQGGDMTIFTENPHVTAVPLLTPFERPVNPSMSFQQTNQQFDLNLTNTPGAQTSLACSMAANNFNIPADGGANNNMMPVTATNEMDNGENFPTNFSNRLLDLDNQQSIDLNLDYSLPVLDSSLMNFLGSNSNADGDIEENMSNSLQNMSLDKQ